MTTQQKLTRIFVLTSLLIDEIDESTRTPTKQTKEIQDKARELQIILEPVLERFYQSEDVRRSTAFKTIESKINYILNKEVK
jgi:hypothetical protein